MRPYRTAVMASATAFSAVPFDTHTPDSASGSATRPTPRRAAVLVAPTMVTAEPAGTGRAVTVTVMVPLTVRHPIASSDHRQASSSLALPLGIGFVATRMPFVASDVVTVNPSEASDTTAVCTIADGGADDVTWTGAGADIGASGVQATRSSKKAYRIPQHDARTRRSATTAGLGTVGGCL